MFFARVLSRMTLLALLASAFSTFIQAGEVKTNKRVKDLRYGVALWHYFQEDYFPALTELMVAEQRGGIQGHEKHPELMLAGLKMAYGMTDSAELRFRRLLANNTNDSGTLDDQTTNAAWYYLAEIAYIQGDLISSEAYLAELTDTEKANKSALQVKTQSLRLNIALAQHQTEKAEQILAESSHTHSALDWFNLGNAYARSGQLDAASQSFDSALNVFNNKLSITEKDLALRDKIHTAAGYAALMQGKTTDAGSYFQQVQHKGLTSDLALLGYGRAASEAGRYEESLGYYQALSAPAVLSNERVEAGLAVPMVHEKMNQPGLALAGYNQAINSYLDHQQSLDVLITELNQQASFPSLKMGRQSHWLEASRSHIKPSHAYLANLYAESYFQSQLTELNDLHLLADLQKDLMFRLGLLNDSLDLRQQRRKAQGQSYAEMDRARLQQRIHEQLVKRRIEFEAAQDVRDYLAFVDTQSLELLRRIELSGQRVNNLSAYGEKVFDQERLLKKYQGLLLWDAAQDYSANRYQAEKSILEAEQQLERLSIKNSQVAALLNNAPELDIYQQRVADASSRTGLVQLTLERQIAELEAQINGAMVAELESRKRILNEYLNEARLARLRLYESRLYAHEQATVTDVDGMP